MDDVVQLFIDGCVTGGNYWDSLIGWWLAYLDGTCMNNNSGKQILFLFYEDIKHNPRKEIIKIIRFLGDRGGDEYLDINKLLHGKIKDENRDNCESSILDKIVENISFNKQQKEAKRGYKFLYRKGIIGDWMRVLTKEQSDAIDRVTRMKFHAMKQIPYYNQVVQAELNSKL